MTTEEKLKIRTEIAHIIVRYTTVKSKIESYQSMDDVPADEVASEMELLNQVWEQVFIIWDKLEQAMSLETVPFSQIQPAIIQSTNIFNDTLVKIENSIEARQES